MYPIPNNWIHEENTFQIQRLLMYTIMCVLHRYVSCTLEILFYYSPWEEAEKSIFDLIFLCKPIWNYSAHGWILYCLHQTCEIPNKLLWLITTVANLKYFLWSKVLRRLFCGSSKRKNNKLHKLGTTSIVHIYLIWAHYIHTVISLTKHFLLIEHVCE